MPASRRVDPTSVDNGFQRRSRSDLRVVRALLPDYPLRNIGTYRARRLIGPNPAGTVRRCSRRKSCHRHRHPSSGDRIEGTPSEGVARKLDPRRKTGPAIRDQTSARIGGCSARNCDPRRGDRILLLQPLSLKSYGAFLTGRWRVRRHQRSQFPCPAGPWGETPACGSSAISCMLAH